MPTKFDVYNQALLRLRETPLATITEPREARYALDAFWDIVLQEMLEAGFWKFAMRTVRITKDPSVNPTFGMPNAFNKPADWVKTYMVSASEMLDVPLDEWQDESRQIFASVEPIYLRYISNSSVGYGCDPTSWTARFVKAFAFELAYRIAPKVTGASDSLMQSLESDKAIALSAALSFEALREPSKRLQEGRWNQSRRANGRSAYNTGRKF